MGSAVVATTTSELSKFKRVFLFSFFPLCVLCDFVPKPLPTQEARSKDLSLLSYLDILMFRLNQINKETKKQHGFIACAHHAQL